MCCFSVYIIADVIILLGISPPGSLAVCLHTCVCREASVEYLTP